MAEKLLTLQDGNILAMFTPAEWAAYTAPATNGPGPVSLPIPHLCQYGPGADMRRNDCGAACVAMVVRGLTEAEPTVDDIAIRFQQRVNKYMSFSELLRALRAFGLTAEYKRPLYPDDITTALRASQAVIVLVKYPKLPRLARSFNGSHFMVIYGVGSDRFLYHDPLEASDEPLRIQADDLKKAMGGFEPGENLPYQGIVVGK